MAILISQKNASSMVSSAAALTAYTFNAAAANSSSLNLFFGLSDVKETLNYNGGNLKVADVSTGDIFNITDTAPATAIGVYRSGNTVIVTNNAKTYTFGALASSETFTVTFGTGVKSIDIARNAGDIITWAYTIPNGVGAATLNVDHTSSPLDVAAPTATATTLLTNTYANATVQSTETGTAFLVKNTITVTSSTNLISLEAANGASVNSAAVTANVSNSAFSTAGLVDGIYNLYTVDVAGNVSAAATNTINIITAMSGTILNPVTTQTGWNDIINGNQGAPANTVNFDATGGVDTYVISTNSGANILINGFSSASAGDTLVFDIGSYTGGHTAFSAANTSTGYYSFADNGTDTVLTHNTDGAIQSITLAGIWDSTNAVGGTIDTLDELNTVLALNSGSVIGYDSLFVASDTTFSATFYKAGTVGLYDSTNTLLSSTTATPLTANTTATFTVAARTIASSATLEMRDAAGTVIKSTNVILGTTAADATATLDGTANDDVIFGFDGADLIDGKAGNDVIYGGVGDDSITGGAGNDSITGGAGADTFNVDSGTDTITDFLSGYDLLVISSGATAHVYASTVATGTSAITYNAVTNAGMLYVDGATLSDGTTDVTGAETITGSAGADSITGGAGADNITGGGGIDSITGGAGDDIITGGAGADVITGGAGADKFRFATIADITTSANVDKITDFVTGSDKIAIQGDAGASATLLGLTLVTATATAAVMNTAIADATSVATIADVYAALATSLDNTTGHEFTGSTATADGLVARVVTFATGTAAGTYLVVNDSTAAFQATYDLVINLTGITGGAFAASDIMMTA